MIDGTLEGTSDWSIDGKCEWIINWFQDRVLEGNVVGMMDGRKEGISDNI